LKRPTPERRSLELPGLANGEFDRYEEKHVFLYYILKTPFTTDTTAVTNGLGRFVPLALLFLSLDRALRRESAGAERIEIRFAEHQHR
jgi:hypothetical protein